MMETMRNMMRGPAEEHSMIRNETHWQASTPSTRSLKQWVKKGTWTLGIDLFSCLKSSHDGGLDDWNNSEKSMFSFWCDGLFSIAVGDEIKEHSSSPKRHAKRVAYKGFEGDDNSAAVREFYTEHDGIPYNSYHQVFEALNNGSIDSAVVPIEDATCGPVSEIYDCLNKHKDIQISGEKAYTVDTCLAALPGVKIADVEEIYSHYHGMEAFQDHFSSSKVSHIPSSDYLESVRLLRSKNSMNCAAVTTTRLAKLYNLEMLKVGAIENGIIPNRIVKLSRKVSHDPKDEKGECVTSIMLRLAPSDSLNSVLSTFIANGIDIRGIHSQLLKPSAQAPFQGRQHRVFFLDVLGVPSEPLCKRAFAKIQRISCNFRILGSYLRSLSI